MIVTVENQEIPIEEDTTAAELKEEANLSDDAVLTYRGENGFESLNDGDIVAEHADENTRLMPQPLADENVFGSP
jgi:sulfur carrier protein ThiS